MQHLTTTPETHDPQSRVKSRIRGVEHAFACVEPACGGSNPNEPPCGKDAVRERTAITRCAGNTSEASSVRTDTITSFGRYCDFLRPEDCEFGIEETAPHSMPVNPGGFYARTYP